MQKMKPATSTESQEFIRENWGKERIYFYRAAGKLSVGSHLFMDKFTDSPVLVMDEKESM